MMPLVARIPAHDPSGFPPRLAVLGRDIRTPNNAGQIPSHPSTVFEMWFGSNGIPLLSTP